uniref:GATA-type domain-containing protein n=1 Tax=Mycena chlorophos TaxID=658473 RepID=A0ABQ0LC44_MYCCL|nr:predicted protein [Mycena chlorophos]
MALETSLDLAQSSTGSQQASQAVESPIPVAITIHKKPTSKQRPARRPRNSSAERPTECPVCHAPSPKQWRMGICSQIHVCNPCSNYKYEANHMKPRPARLEVQRVKRRRAGGMR